MSSVPKLMTAIPFIFRTREEHLQLSQGGVLGLVQDDEGAVQGPAPHVGQRRDLDDALLHEYLQLAGMDHVMQGIVQGLEVRVQLLLHVAGQESQSLAGLHCRACEYQFLHLLVFQRPDSQRDGRVRLTCACRAEGEDEVVAVVLVDQTALVAGAGLDDAALIAVDDVVVFLIVRRLPFLELRGIGLPVEHSFQVAVADPASPAEDGREGLYPLREQLHLLVRPLEPDVRPPGDDPHFGEIVSHSVQLPVIDPVDVHGVKTLD